ncbi:hypothetical protein [Viscerimonas tarda]
MENKEIKMLLLHKRMEAKGKIEKFNYLTENTRLSFKNEIDKLLDLINEIDKALEKLD